MSELEQAIVELTSEQREAVDDARSPALSPREQTRIDVLMLVAHAAAIDVDELRKMKAELDRFDAVGCMFDPTQWIRTANARQVSSKIVNAVLAFRAALEAKS